MKAKYINEIKALLCGNGEKGCYSVMSKKTACVMLTKLNCKPSKMDEAIKLLIEPYDGTGSVPKLNDDERKAEIERLMVVLRLK